MPDLFEGLFYLAVVVLAGYFMFVGIDATINGYANKIYIDQRKEHFNRVCLHHHTPKECGITKMTRDYWAECIEANKLDVCGDLPTDEE